MEQQQQNDGIQRLLNKISERQGHLSFASEGSDHNSNSEKKGDDNPVVERLKHQLDTQLDKRLNSIRSSINSVPTSKKMSSFAQHSSDQNEVDSDEQHALQMDKVQKLIAKTKSKLRINKVTQEQQFYKKNMKKFEQLDTFINAKALMTGLNTEQKSQPTQQSNTHADRHQHPISMNGHDKRASVYMDYLIFQEKKELEQAKSESQLQKRLRQKKVEAFFEEYHGMFWEANHDNQKSNFENENLNRYNDFKYLMYLETFLQEAQKLKDKQNEEDQDMKIKKALDESQLLELQQNILKQIQMSHHHKLEESQVKSIQSLHQKQEQDHFKEVAQEFKKQSDKVLIMIRSAAKKIFNKKSDVIEKELIKAKSARIKRVQQIQKIDDEIKERVLKPQTPMLKPSTPLSKPSTPALTKESLDRLHGNLKTQNTKSIFYRAKLPKLKSNHSDQISNSHDDIGMVSPNSSLQQRSMNKQEEKKFELKQPDQFNPYESLEHIRLQRMLNQLQKIHKGNIDHDKKIKELTKVSSRYYSSLENISKPHSIKQTLTSLLEKNRIHYNKNFYRNVKNSFKRQVL